MAHNIEGSDHQSPLSVILVLSGLVFGVFFFNNYLGNWRAATLCERDASNVAVFEIPFNATDTVEERELLQNEVVSKYEFYCSSKYGSFPIIKITPTESYTTYFDPEFKLPDLSKSLKYID